MFSYPKGLKTHDYGNSVFLCSKFLIKVIKEILFCIPFTFSMKSNYLKAFKNILTIRYCALRVKFSDNNSMVNLQKPSLLINCMASPAILEKLDFYFPGENHFTGLLVRKRQKHRKSVFSCIYTYVVCKGL